MRLEELQLNESCAMFSDQRQIYIVDDDESVRRALKIILNTHEFQVKTFSSAEDFFSAVPNSCPGCLILDIHMPGLKGWEAQERLTKSGSKRPIIFISTEDKNGALKERALIAGAVGFLQKPFDDQELVELVNQTYTTTRRMG